MKLLSACVILSAAAIITSCGPDPEPGPTAAEMLMTASPWKNFSTMARISSSEPWQDLPIQNGPETISPLPACSADDVHTYLADGTFTIDSSVQKCHASEPQVLYNATWELGSDGESLTITSNGGAITTYVITRLDTEILQIETQYGDIYIQTTYQH